MQEFDRRVTACWIYKDLGDSGSFLKHGAGVREFWDAVHKRLLWSSHLSNPV